jgi:hypothetical protein
MNTFKWLFSLNSAPLWILLILFSVMGWSCSHQTEIQEKYEAAQITQVAGTTPKVEIPEVNLPQRYRYTVIVNLGGKKIEHYANEVSWGDHFIHIKDIDTFYLNVEAKVIRNR